MANFSEQVFQAWAEFEEETGNYINNPDDFIAWASKLTPEQRKEIARKAAVERWRSKGS